MHGLVAIQNSLPQALLVGQQGIDLLPDLVDAVEIRLEHAEQQHQDGAALFVVFLGDCRLQF